MSALIKSLFECMKRQRARITLSLQRRLYEGFCACLMFVVQNPFGHLSSVCLSLLVLSSGRVKVLSDQVSLGHFMAAINFKCYKCPKGEIHGSMEAYDIYS